MSPSFVFRANMTNFYNIKSAIYYVPGIIGTHPLHGSEGVLASDVPIFTSAFEAIHDRDLDWLAQVTDTIRMPGLVPYPYGKDTYFLDKLASKGLKAIVSFSFRRYRYSSVVDEATFRDVVDDFTDFIKNLNHEAVIAICLGDVDDEWGDLTSVTTTSPVRPLLSTLIELSRASLVGIPVTVALPWDATWEAEALLTLLRGLSFDFWVFDVSRSTGLHAITALKKYPGGGRPSLLQISQSAWDYQLHKADHEQQIHYYTQMLEFIQSQPDRPNRIVAPIFFEWADQWWRLLHGSSCIVDAPYNHDSCGTVKRYTPSEVSAFDAIEYDGLCAQFDMPFALHCISPRPSLFTVANFTGRTPNFDLSSTTCAQTILVSSTYIWILLPMILIVLAGVVVLACCSKKHKHHLSDLKKQNKKPKQMTFGLSPEEWQRYFQVHYTVASECVDLFLSQEAALIAAEGLDLKPEKVLADRLLQGYYDQHPGAQGFIESQPTEDVIRACKIYRTIFSLGEQAAYCPTVTNNLFHRLLTAEDEIDLGELQKGLDRLEEPKTFRFLCCFANKTNFDDKEDAARLQIQRTMPTKIPANLSLTRNDQGVGKVEVTSAGPVRSSFLEFTSVFVLLDFLSHYRFILYLKIWVLASAYYFANEYSPGTSSEDIKNFRAIWVQPWGSFSAFFVYFDAYLRAVCEATLLICSLRLLLVRNPKNSSTPASKRLLTIIGTLNPCVTAAVPLLLILDRPIEWLLVWRAVEATYLFAFRILRNRSRNKKKRLSPWRRLDWLVLFSKKLLFWTVVFALTWFIEAFLLSAVVKNFTPYLVCTKTAQVCTEECLSTYNPACSTQCMSCKVGVYIMYAMFVLGSFLDSHLVFNLILTGLGYLVGIQEKVSAVYYDKVFDWASCSELLQKAFPEVRGETTDIRALWETIIQDLRNRHLISRQQTEKLKLRSDEPLAVRSLGLGPEAKDRLLFFYRTLKAVGERNPRTTVEPLTLSITTYDEHVLKPVHSLRRKQGEKTELEHVIDNCPDEWKYACEQFCERGTLEGKTADDILYMFISGQTDQRQYDWLEWEIQKWASYRQQTVARTIRGCTNYFAALQFLLNKRDITRRDGELLVAHQTYATIPRTGTPVDAVMDWLDRIESVEKIFYEFQEFRECMFLVYDYEYIVGQNKCPFKIAKKEGQSKSLTELRVQQKFFALRQQFEEFLASRRPDYDFPCEKWSVLASVRNGKLSIIQILPRQCKLRLENAQGKSANQLNMIRFASGHYIQVNDANMDLWMGEAFKFPFTCNMFLNRKERMPQYRIIGFREYIYTQFSGPTGNFMGQSEFVFGTIISRAMRFLGSRLHYGHPDFFDMMWVYVTGGLSKASAGINTSEDIFAGFTILLRESGKKVYSSDLLEGQKGREEVFLPASGFLSKISSGFVAMQSSRDLYRLTDRLPLFGLLGLYFGSAGFYVANVIVDVSQYAYMLGFMFLALGSVSLHDVGALGSSLGSEWLVTAAVTALPPLLLELVLEYGMVAGFTKLMAGIISMRNSLMFFVFQNKVVSSSVIQAIITGEAAWVNTGRPSFYQHYTKAKAYSTYATSNYAAGTELLIIYSIYQHFADAGGGSHPMYIPVAAAIMWLVTPAIFTPQLGGFQLFKEDVYESFQWLTMDIAQPSVWYGDKDDHCFNSFWWGVNNRRTNAAVFITLFITFVVNMLMISSIYTAYIETLICYLPVLLLQTCTTIIWIRLKGGPLYTTFYLGAPLLSFVLIMSLAVPYSYGEWWISLLMLLVFASFWRSLILVCVHFLKLFAVCKCKRKKQEEPEGAGAAGFLKLEEAKEGKEGEAKEAKAEGEEKLPEDAKEGDKKGKKKKEKKPRTPWVPFWEKHIWNLNRFLFYATFQFHYKWAIAITIMLAQFAVNFVFLCFIFIWKQSQLLFAKYI